MVEGKKSKGKCVLVPCSKVGNQAAQLTDVVMFFSPPGGPTGLWNLGIPHSVEYSDGDVCRVGCFEKGTNAVLAVGKGEGKDFLELHVFKDESCNGQQKRGGEQASEWMDR